MNAELWCQIGQERQTLKSWFHYHNIKYDKNLSTEELRKLYIKEIVKNGRY